jgi:hypothetical protein
VVLSIGLKLALFNKIIGGKRENIKLYIHCNNDEYKWYNQSVDKCRKAHCMFKEYMIRNNLIMYRQAFL